MGNVLESRGSLGACGSHCQPSASTEPLLGAWLVATAVNAYLALTVYQALLSMLLHLITHLLFPVRGGRGNSNYLPFSDETAEARRSNLLKAT